MDPTQIAALVIRAQRGDQAAFGKLVEGLSPALLNMLCTRFGAEEAKDCLQDAWLNAWQRITEYKEGNFRAWVFTIARNLGMNVSRSAANRTQRMVAEVGQEQPDYLVAKEIDEALKRCLNQLSPDEKEIFENKFYGGDEHLAQQLDITIENLHTRRRRIKGKLRKCLETHHITG